MFSKPDQNLNYLGLQEGWRVADFGAGSGAYALELARRVGPSGRVYAVEVQRDLLTRLTASASAEKIRNLEIIWGDVERAGGSKLRDGSVDLVLVANILFQSTARYSLLQEARRVLRPSGRLAIIDWQESFNNLGPTANQIITSAVAKEILLSLGFSIIREFPAGEHHWGLIAAAPSAT